MMETPIKNNTTRNATNSSNMEQKMRYLNSACMIAVGTEPELDAAQAKENLRQLQEKHSRESIDKLVESQRCGPKPRDGTSLRLEYLAVKARPHLTTLQDTNHVRAAMKTMLDTVCTTKHDEALVWDMYTRYLEGAWLPLPIQSNLNKQFVVDMYNGYIETRRKDIVAQIKTKVQIVDKQLAAKFGELVDQANDLFTDANGQPVDLLFYGKCPDEKSVVDYDDRIRILCDMHRLNEAKFVQLFAGQLEGLFMHADNIRCWMGKQNTPVWFFEKYGKFFQ